MKILLKVEEAPIKFELLKELFQGSEFEIELITQENESMSGHVTTQNWIQIKKEDVK